MLLLLLLLATTVMMVLVVAVILVDVFVVVGAVLSRRWRRRGDAERALLEVGVRRVGRTVETGAAVVGVRRQRVGAGSCKTSFHSWHAVEFFPSNKRPLEGGTAYSYSFL
jgi:uncharacterized membrane protein YhaH (DUF805 family)